MNIIKYIVSICLLFLSFWGCSKDKKPKAIINSISELKDLHNYKDFFLITKEINLESKKESIISFPYTLVVKNNNLIIVASRNTPILEFNFEGKFIRKIGQLGNGPGEYNQINSIFILKDEIGIFDFSNQKITLFDENVQYLREFRLPINQVVSLRSIITVNKYIYIHVPYTRDFPYHILEIDTNGLVKRKFVKAKKYYSNYSFFGLFHGSIIKNESDSILYEMNSFSNNKLNKINLYTGTSEVIKLPKPKYFHKIKRIKEKNSIDNIRKNFYLGTDVLNMFLLHDKYLVVQYLNKAYTNNQVTYIIYDLEDLTFKKFNNLNATYSSGKYLYGLEYNDKNSKHKEDIFSNPKLIIMKLKNGELK